MTNYAKRFIVLFLAMTVLVGAMPAKVFAAVGIRNSAGTTTIFIEDGEISLRGNDAGTIFYEQSGIAGTASSVMITNRDNSVASSNGISIFADKGEMIAVVIDDLKIDATGTGNAAISVLGGGEIAIEMNGESYLTGDAENAGIHVSEKSSLIINATDNDGKITVQGGLHAAGIGGNTDDSSGQITINNGTILATGGGINPNITGTPVNGQGNHGGGAGIGSGETVDNNNTTGDIIINGGSITAIGGTRAAGIGSGFNTESGTITINQGTVNATGGPTAEYANGYYMGFTGSGIGGSETSGGGIITINGGRITASGDAGIGSGINNYSSGTEIVINAGEIYAYGGAGIACDAFEDTDAKNTILIKGGTITAINEGNGYNWGAAIGGHVHGCLDSITIEGGTIVAQNKVWGPGIGLGENSLDTTANIIISGGEITAVGGAEQPGIGGGETNNPGVNIIISGGEVSSTGGRSATDIGSATAALSSREFCSGAIYVDSIVAANGDWTSVEIGNGKEQSHIHVYSKLTFDKPATCITPRRITFECLLEDCPESDRIISYFQASEPLGHNFVRDPARDVAATPDATGVEAYTCSRCDETNDQIVEYEGNICPHFNVIATYDPTITPIFENITDTHHDVRNGYSMICNACSQPTGETGYFEAVTEEHTYVNGECVCGAKKTINLAAPIPTQSSMTVNRGETITISWAASEGAERYGVWFYDTDPATYVDAGSNLSVTHTFAHNSPANSPFAVQIYALAGSGENQKQSEPGVVLVTVGCAEGEHDFTGASVWDRTLYKEIPGDHQFHLAYADVYKQTCIECGMGGFEQIIERTEAQQEKEAHYYVNGVCQVEGCKHVCGHQYEDKLNNGAPIYVDGTDVWQNQGEAGHVCTSVEVETQCAYCQLESTRVVENPWGSEVQAHMIKTTVTEYGYDDFEHWPVKVRATCSAPGCDYDAPKATEGKHEPHKMVEGNCTLCGNGVQTGTFKYGGFINPEADATATYYYSDSYFDADATAEPNPHLATMSLCLELSAWTSFDTGKYWIGAEKTQNVSKLLNEIGFKDFASNLKWESKPEMNSIGAVAAYKNIEDSTVIALAVRGGGYASEWGGNFVIGEDGNHEGFEIARDEVLDFLKRYIEAHKSEFKPTVKLWLVGFSRGGATANMTAGALLDNEVNVGIAFKPENLFAYTYEAPMGYLGDNSGYESIKNYVLSYDLVPLVAPSDWGFGRYNDHDQLLLEGSLGTSRYNQLVKEFQVQYNKVLEGIPYSDKNQNPNYRLKAYADEFYYNLTTPWKLTIPSSDIKVDLSPALAIECGFVQSAVPTDKMLSDTVDLLFDYIPGLRKGYSTNLEKGLTEFISFLKDYEEPKLDWGKAINDAFLTEDYKGAKSLINILIAPGLLTNADQRIEKAATLAAQMLCNEVLSQTGNGISTEFERTLAGFLSAAFDAFYDSPDKLISVAYYLATTSFQCHWPEISLAWLMSKDSYYADQESTSIKDLHPEIWRTIAINCPVDVIIYDENGNEFASIRGESITNTSDVHGVSITETGTKQIILPSDAGYSVKIIATDEGIMDYSVLEYNVRDRKYNLVQSYQDLSLTTGESYHGDIPAFHTDDYYDEESDGSTTKYTLRGPNGNELQPTTVLRGNNVYNATVSLSTNNNKGIVTGGGTFVATEYAQVEAVCMPTVEFLGWYKNGQLVSTEQVYRFEVLEDTELVAHFSEGDYHTLRVTSTEGGIVPEGSCEIPATVQIQISAEACEGYEFVRWEATAGSFDNPQKIDALFTMPSEDVTVMAVFQAVKAPPKTGDDTPLGLYMLLLGLSASVVIASVSKRKTKFGK